MAKGNHHSHGIANHEWRLAMTIVLLGLGTVAFLWSVPKPSAPKSPYDRLPSGVGYAKLVSTTPREVRTLVQGPESYSVSTSGPGPKVTKVDIDNFDPKPGEMQSFKVSANHSKPISEVSLKMLTDHGTKEYELYKKSGSDKDGVWEGGWRVDDTHEYVYSAIVKTNSDQPTIVTLTFR